MFSVVQVTCCFRRKENDIAWCYVMSRASPEFVAGIRVPRLYYIHWGVRLSFLVVLFVLSITPGEGKPSHRLCHMA